MLVFFFLTLNSLNQYYNISYLTYYTHINVLLEIPNNMTIPNTQKSKLYIFSCNSIINVNTIYQIYIRYTYTH